MPPETTNSPNPDPDQPTNIIPDQQLPPPPPTLDDTISDDSSSQTPAPSSIISPSAPADTPKPVESSIVADELKEMDRPEESVPAAEPQTAPPKTTVGGPKKSRSALALLLVIALVLVLGGVAAAAYYGYVVPNQPQNVLKTAIQNTLQQTEASFNGNLTVDSTNSKSPSLKVDFQGSSNLSSKSADLQLNLTSSGVSLPFETRLVNQNLYLKVGDLSSITTLVKSFSPKLSSSISALSETLSNKWIVIDSTLLKQAGGSCPLDNTWAITKTDINYLEAQYANNRFVTIKDTASDSVNGQPATKFDLSIDNGKSAAYMTSLNQLPLAKAIRGCTNTTPKAPLNTIKVITGSTPLTVWVDKANHRIVKIASQSTAQQIQKLHQNSSASIIFSYQPVSITAPNGALPLIQLLSELKSQSNDSALQSLISANSFSL
ncbi:MAG TPA: hypothetical protein VNE40_00265 [Candidatus Dormibacteraeota bacterium]|nr:hypothetical protein [Candidatus Dormibacteraeota bacterium]